MKRYIRTQGGMFIDTEKTTVFVESGAGFPQLCIEDPDTADYFVVCVERESDNILDLINEDDLVRFKGLHSTCDDYFYEYILPDILIDFASAKTISDNFEKGDLAHIEEIRTKLGNDYVLVWDKNRGVVRC